MTDARPSAMRRADVCRLLLRRWWPLIVLVAAWQLWVDINSLPSSCHCRCRCLPTWWDTPRFTCPAAFRRRRRVRGMVLGLALAPAAILAWWSPLLGGMLTPLSLVFSSIPVVTVIPILARMFGYDMRTVIVIVGIISFFPAFVFSTAGLRNLPAGSADLMTALGASRWRWLVLLALPAAVPSWMIALRIAAPGAILAAMLAEFLMGTSGLGYLFVTAKAAFDMNRALGTSLVATLVSLSSFIVVGWAESRVRASWQ